MKLQITDTSDYELTAKLNEEIQTFHHTLNPEIFKPYNKESVSEFFKSILENKENKILIARDGETPVGYVLIQTVHHPENPFQYARSFILIDQLWVSEKYRKMGVATALLNAVTEIARSNNITMLELNHWTQNDTARKFFTQNGFEYYNEKMWRRIVNL